MKSTDAMNSRTLSFAVLAASVAVLRMGGEPKRRSTSAKSGSSSATSCITCSSGTAAPMRQAPGVVFTSRSSATLPR